MPDGNDPGRIDRYTDRQVERVRRCVPEPNRSDILKTIRKGRRGHIPSPKPNEQTKPAWGKQTIRNNARNLRILAGELAGLNSAEYDGVEWDRKKGRDNWPDRILNLSPQNVNDFITTLAIERDWSDGNERDYCLCTRNHFLAHDHVDTATQINYPQVGHENTAVDIDTVPTREDLYSIIDGENVRDKALYTTLWESGNRVTAHAALKIKHWKPKGHGYGVIQVPGQHVTGLKGAEHSAKPITFARGYLDEWLSDHPLADDPDAPLFCPTRPQDDPNEHLHPHSIATQLYRIARRTDAVDEDHISPHAFKHGRASEMRASERYDKDDIEQILDWEEGTPMHGRYEHVTEEDEAERILRKHGFEPEDGSDAVEQHECPRCGTVVSVEADYCPSCALRQHDEPPRWWQIYCKATDEDDPVREKYSEEVPPADVAELVPDLFDHVKRVLLSGMIGGAVRSEMDGALTKEQKETYHRSIANPDDRQWIYDNISGIDKQHVEEHPHAAAIRRSETS